MMTGFIDQLPTLVGVTLGAVGAIASSTLSDRLHWRREQTVRWDERRLDSYNEFSTTLKEIVSLSFRLTAVFRPGSSTQPIDREVGLELLTQADLRKTKDWELLLLLGDDATVGAGRRWRDATRRVERITRAETWDRAAWEAAVHEVNNARDDFHNEARRHLGVRAASVEQSAFLSVERSESEGPIELVT